MRKSAKKWWILWIVQIASSKLDAGLKNSRNIWIMIMSEPILPKNLSLV